MPRKSKVQPLLVILALMGFGVSAAAAEQCPTRKNEIATDRPDVTNSSLVVPTGSFQSENGINLSRRDGASYLDGTNSRLRLGVAPCLEVLVDVPNYFAVLNGEGSSGATDVIPAIKWQMSPLPGKIDLSAVVGGGIADWNPEYRRTGPRAVCAVPMVMETHRRVEPKWHGHCVLLSG